MKQLGQVRALDGRDSVVLPPVLRALGGGRAEHHVRVVDEIAVDREALRHRADVYPIRQLCYGLLTPLQEDDVRDDVRTRVGAEGVVGESDRAEQLAALGEIAAHALVLGVERVARGDEGHNAARTHLVEHLGGKVVVDGESEPVILRVVDLVLAERHVADGEVIKAGAVRRLKARDGDVRFRVELLCYAPGDAVQFHAVELAALHGFRQQAEEVADAHRRLKDAPALESNAAHSLIDGADDRGRGVVRVERRASRRLVFFRREQGFQLCVFL